MFGDRADTSPIRLVLKSERGIPGFPDYPLLEDLHCQCAASTGEIEQILGENVLRVWEEVEATADRLQQETWWTVTP